MPATILLIDDKTDFLHELETALKARLPDVNIVPWAPKDDEKPKTKFEEFYKNNDIRLVITDYDLTESGPLGFFGATVVDWCHEKAIPVGDFSRGRQESLPTEPNLFELRVPVISNDEAADYIAAVFSGFESIRLAISSDATLTKRRSPTSALAALLGVKNDESQFSQYGTRYGGANSALAGRLFKTVSETKTPSDADKAAILSYIVGHLLLNAVLKFPGPIINKVALSAYLGISQTELNAVTPLFSDAAYRGPFMELGPYFWTGKVDTVLASIAPSDGQEYETLGEMQRTVLEVKIGRKLARPEGCNRCQGKNGGFLCPFTSRTVCQRADCSVTSSVWIPPGARLSRIERDFYDEWAPILGM